MDCSVAEKNINSFIRGTLKGNKLRKVYYHLKKCAKCREVLLDEFSFYMTFNDLDKDLNFNYQKNLDKLMADTEFDIKRNDAIIKQNYFAMSVAICAFFLLLLIIAIKVVYR